MAAILTPGLTRLQADRLRADLLQLTGLAEASAAGIYIDADRLAGRAMLSHHAADHMHARWIVAQLVAEHCQDGTLIAYIAGLAYGVRLGRRFAPPPVARSKWISAEYRALTEPNRRDVQRYIRKLLKAQQPVRSPAPPVAVEIEAARQWTRRMGAAARRAG